MVAFSEDVGRHNTVDKVIGQASINRLNFKECFMIITGRVPGDMIYKAAKVGFTHRRFSGGSAQFGHCISGESQYHFGRVRAGQTHECIYLPPENPALDPFFAPCLVSQSAVSQ